MRGLGARRALGLGAAVVATLAAPIEVVATVPDGPPPPMLTVEAMAELGWAPLVVCDVQANGHSCIYGGGGGANLAVLMMPLRPIDDVEFMVSSIAGASCANGTPIDVGGRADTVLCAVEEQGVVTQAAMVFANGSWLFNVIRLADGEPSPEVVASLLTLRDRQLDEAGGERPTTTPTTPSGTAAPTTEVDAASLDRFLPDVVPEGWLPPGGITTDFETLGSLSEDEISVTPGDWEFLKRRSVTRGRLWIRDDGYTLAVFVTEYPYELLAGLALGTLEHLSFTPIETPLTLQVEDLLAVDASANTEDGTPFVIENFRRGRYEFTVMVSGPDTAGSVALASAVVPLVADLAPTRGPTAPVWPPSPLVSLLRAAIVTMAVVVGALTLRRLIGGRARRASPLQQPRPMADDVSAAAARLRRRGRLLGGVQVLACSIIVVALVADIGWWWPVVATAGLAIGVLATAVARHYERGRSIRHWSLTSWRTWLFGAVGAGLIVAGVALAVRGLDEAVLLPSITHLRIAAHFGTTPQRLSLVMAAAGLGLLVAGAVALRRSRAHARSALARGSGQGDAILYLRSFDDDRLSVPNVHSARRPFFELFGMRGRDPFEESIAWELASHGTVFAVGRPGRSTASLGAARSVLADDEWRAAVIERMDSARYVVAAIGSTEGLAWELNVLATRGHLDKTILVVPPGNDAAIESRWLATRRAIDEAYGRGFVEPVAVVGTLTARIDGTSGRVSTTRADRVDEAGYRAAIIHALAPPRFAPFRPPRGLPVPLPAPISL